jgi:phosphoribosylaminoimidazolecarboxamide formyltransferase/IMP cyclohydrolase
VHPESGVKQIRRALLSVTDKAGLVEFARTLAGFGVELVSTGGTARALRDAGLAVNDISDLTGFPEMLDGRVKTLHPRVHGGLLYIRGNREHEASVAAHGIAPIDMVVVNLYAFEKSAAQPGVPFGHLIENIDIGGPSMVRSAAKNFEDVAIVTRVADYPALIDELTSNGGALSRSTRWRLARQAFSLTAAYDTAIANELDRIAEAPAPDAPAVLDQTSLPTALRLNMPMAQPLRYGENPHQRAALYADGSGLGVAGAEQLQGKELSFNNLVDLDACWDLAREFDEPAVIIVKHTNPCGAATGTSVLEAYQKALAADPVSAFGGGWSGGAGDREVVCRGHCRAGLHARGARAVRSQKEPSPGEGACRAVQARGQAGFGRHVAAGGRYRPADGIRAEGGDAALAERGGVAQPALRLACVQAREVECDRLRP